MNTRIQLSIPQPCHEGWAAMSPTEKGRFCDSCQKEVIDFTKSSDREIAAVLENSTNVCARILPSQTDRELIIPHHRKHRAATVAAVAVLAVSPALTYAQTPVQTEQQPAVRNTTMLGKAVIIKSLNMVQGTVVDEENLPAPGVNIAVKGTNATTSTDIDGKFSVQAEKGDTLQITSIGYQELEIIVDEQDFTKPLQLRSEPVILGGMMVMRERTFFGKMFHGIGNLFR